MSDNIRTTAGEVTPLSADNLMYDFLSTADGSTFSICAALYDMIMDSEEEQRPQLFELAINLYEDVESDESVQVESSAYEKQKDDLKEKYGEFVNSSIEFLIAKNDPANIFYQNLWETIQNKIFFPTDAAKVFAFYYVVIDRRVPYFELGQGYLMSNEAYRKLRRKHASLLKKIRYILNAELDQKTERASFLLNELGIAIPDEEVGVEIVNEYEKFLMVMVEILNTTTRPDLPFEAIIRNMRDKLSE